MVDEKSEIYDSREYNESWKSACCTALREIRAAGTTSEINLIQSNTGVQFPAHKPVGDSVVSIYFLSFVAFKVSFYTFYIFLHFSFNILTTF